MEIEAKMSIVRIYSINYYDNSWTMWPLNVLPIS
jgi:hypothetical protein